MHDEDNLTTCLDKRFDDPARGGDFQCKRRLFDLNCAMDGRERDGLAFVAVGRKEGSEAVEGVGGVPGTRGEDNNGFHCR